MKKMIHFCAMLLMLGGSVLLGITLFTNTTALSLEQEILIPLLTPPCSPTPSKQEVFLATEQSPSPEETLFVPIEQKSSPAQTIPILSDPYIDPAKPMVALTFDDGPGLRTMEILSLLQENHGRATFFLVGNMIQDHQEVLRQIVAQDSQIGNHSWSHTSLSSLSYEKVLQDVEKTNQVIESLCGVKPTLLRPPYGNRKGSVIKASKALDLCVILWSIDTLDWKTRSSKTTYDTIMSQVKDGSIVLCHDIHDSTVDAMHQLIPALTQMGYQLVTVSELLQYKYGAQLPGVLYFNGYDPLPTP
ncbi:MAG: polysaccharide deacetylase family protein [Clostridiales bacterium]|nr:polysaccharide deacetylase family protein [Clostridiales bacterium]